MKKLYLFAIPALLIALGLQSCDEDFQVSAPYKDITVAYGILDMGDSSHYIRIQKAFLDENKSAIDMSKEPDSSFYENLDVTLLEYNDQRTQVLNSISLSKVNLNNEGDDFKKEEPVTDQQFFTDPHYAYKFTNNDLQLNPFNWYQLILTNNNTGRIDSSEFIGVVSNSSDRAQQGLWVREFEFGNSFSVSFARTLPANTFKILVFMPKNGRSVEGYIRFNYVDRNILTGEETDKHVDYLFDREQNITSAGTSFVLEVPNSDIYSFLNASIGAPPSDNIERLVDSCDVYVYVASPEIYFFNQINQGQTGGLTNDNIQPTYSNFKGDDIIGVVGSRAMRIKNNVPIDKTTLDSIMINPATEPLRIRGRSSR